MTPTSPTPNAVDHTDDGPARLGASRRGFLGYVVGATTLVVAADLRLGTPAYAAVPSPPQIAEAYDLSDLLTDAARPTANLITIAVNPDGTVSFELPRAEVGQGITTVDGDDRSPTRSTSRSTRCGSRSRRRAGAGVEPAHRRVEHDHAIYTPVRVAAAIARAAARGGGDELGVARWPLDVRGRRDHRAGRRSVDLRRAGREAAPQHDRRGRGRAEGALAFAGRRQPRSRVDARDIVTGRKKFAMDLDVPDALPTMVCRAADDQRHAGSVRNLADGAGDAGRHRRRDQSPPVSRCGARRSGSASTRSARSRGPGARHRRRQVRRDVLADLKRGRAADGAAAAPLAKIDRGEFTLPLPPRRPAGDELPRSPTCAPTAPRSGRPEVADRGPGAASP